MVTALKRSRLILSHSKDGLTSYRLTAAGRAYLLQHLSQRTGPYLTPTRQLKSEYRRRIRNHRVSESYVFLERAGAGIYPDRKPWPFPACTTPPQPSSAYFYGSREVRACSPEAAKIENARFTGCLVSPAGVLLTYNTGDHPIKWESKSEQRTKAFVSQLLTAQQGTLIHLDDIGGLMLGRDMDTGYQLLTSNGGDKRAYFRVDGTFQRFPYLPLTAEGELTAKLLWDPVLNNSLRSTLLSGYRPAGHSTIEQDAYDDSGTPLLLAYDFDLQRIHNFYAGLQLHGIQGAAICFDFQTDALRRYLGDQAEVRAIDLLQFERRFLNPSL